MRIINTRLKELAQIICAYR